MKRILITGKSGYIASSLSDYLGRFPDTYAVESISLRDDGWRASEFSAYDAVVHCAGLAHIRETVENAHYYYEINRDLTLSVARKAEAAGVRQFIFLSSLSVYGMDEGVITPETLPRPKTAYGKSKLEAEYALRAMDSESFRVAILRPPMVYGTGCKGNYQTLVKLARKLPAIPTYKNQRSAVSVHRLCEIIREVIDAETQGIFVPQDEEYLCTCAELQKLAAGQGRRCVPTGMLNFGPALLRRFTAKGRKAFGNLIYKG
jgi:UDP-glucose 4-epimerase